MSGMRETPRAKPAPGPWAEYANCAGLPADWFFPEAARSSTYMIEARKVCAACAVREQCFDYAMSSPLEITGLWGGTTPRERQRLARQRRLRGAS